MNNQEVEIVIIRHAQSEYNFKAEKLREKYQIGATWEEYKKCPQFMLFKYSDQVIDCSLSERGQQQCQALRKKEVMDNIIEADLVLVSPLYRALRTCWLLFRGTKIEDRVIVEPVLSESMRCSCDVSMKLYEAKKEFKKFDYSKVNGRQKQWYLQNQEPEKIKIYREVLQSQKATTYEDWAKTLVRYMGQTHNFQGPHDLINRMKKGRKILKDYALKHSASKIVIVSHYYAIIYLISTQFDENGKPAPYPYISNGEPLYYKMDLNIDAEDPKFLLQKKND